MIIDIIDESHKGTWSIRRYPFWDISEAISEDWSRGWWDTRNPYYNRTVTYQNLKRRVSHPKYISKEDFILCCLRDWSWVEEGGLCEGDYYFIEGKSVHMKSYPRFQMARRMEMTGSDVIVDKRALVVVDLEREYKGEEMKWATYYSTRRTSFRRSTFDWGSAPFLVTGEAPEGEGLYVEGVKWDGVREKKPLF